MRPLYGPVRSAAAPLLRALYRVEVSGAGRIPAAGPAIVVANHESMLDPFVLALATPRRIRYLARAELWRLPLLGRALEALGGIPIERGAGDRAALERAAALLAAGELVGVFPQGTVLPYRRRPYLRGAARLALVTGAPIVPVCLVGTERAWRPHRARFGLPRIHVLVAQPIEVARNRPTVAAARALTERLENAIVELHRPYGEPVHAWIEPAA